MSYVLAVSHSLFRQSNSKEQIQIGRLTPSYIYGITIYHISNMQVGVVDNQDILWESKICLVK